MLVIAFLSPTVAVAVSRPLEVKTAIMVDKSSRLIPTCDENGVTVPSV